MKNQFWNKSSASAAPAISGAVELCAEERVNETVITVRDTGMGIAAEELPRIWERLYRGDKSRTERGLGLGLSLVKAIVQGHGGRVEVESDPGNGSTFRVRLPPPAPQAGNQTSIRPAQPSLCSWVG